MSWRTSTEIGLSELAANSVLSVGGAGGLALGAWILRRGGLPTAFIARRTVAFFLLTSLANVGFLALGGIGLATGLLHGSPSILLGLVPAIAAVGAIALALAARSLAGRLARRSMRTRIVAAAEAVGEGVDEALSVLRSRDPAILLGASAYLLFDVAMLGVCFKAFGNDVPPAGVLLVAYLVGQLGSLIPIPGGIGGVDGGLIGTLILYGVDPADAAVAVIAYRGLLLAIPAVLGLPALAILRRRLRDEAHDIAACAPGQAVEVLGRGTVRLTVPASGPPADAAAQAAHGARTADPHPRRGPPDGVDPGAPGRDRSPRAGRAVRVRPAHPRRPQPQGAGLDARGRDPAARARDARQGARPGRRAGPVRGRRTRGPRGRLRRDHHRAAARSSARGGGGATSCTGSQSLGLPVTVVVQRQKSIIDVLDDSISMG